MFGGRTNIIEISVRQCSECQQLQVSTTTWSTQPMEMVYQTMGKASPTFYWAFSWEELFFVLIDAHLKWIECSNVAST